MGSDDTRLRLARGIWARRVELGLKAYEAAALAGVGRDTWRAWEQGTKSPRDSSLAAIAQALDWSVAQLLATREDEEPPPNRPRFDDSDDQAIWDTGERQGWTAEQRLELIQIRQQILAEAEARQPGRRTAG